MTLLLFAAPPVLAALLAYAMTPSVRRLALRIGAIDHPGPRKIHAIPTPRLGGAAVVAAIIIVLAAVFFFAPAGVHAIPPPLLVALALGLLPILSVSLIDDLRSLKAAPKFLAHFAGASIAVALGIHLGSTVHFLGYQLHIGWLAIPISILWLAGITNAFNIVDGLDGLSSGLALISAISLTAVSLLTHHYDMAAAAAVLAGALAGFLPHNIFPAKIYLGDTGATAIGFMLGCLTLGGGSTTSAGLAVILPMVVLGLPLAETTLSMIRRSVRKLNGKTGGIFEADSNHIHHRLLALGFDHKRAVFMLYGVGLLLAGCAFASLFMTQQNAGLLLLTLFIAALVGVAKLGYDEFALVRSGVVLRFYHGPVLRRGLFVVFADLAMVVIALYAAVVLKYDDWGVVTHRAMVLHFLTLLPATTLVVFALMRMYRHSWSVANIDDMIRSSGAVVTSTAVAFLASRFSSPEPASATFFITYMIVLLGLVTASRASYRVLFYLNRKSNQDGDPVVIYGAGKAGALALREILNNSDVTMKPIGFIDDDPAKSGRILNGYPVLGNLTDLSDMVVSGRALGVIVASDKIPMLRVNHAKALCENHGGWMRVFQVNFQLLRTEPDRSRANVG
jgi:UDP-GlcNAc:undecaprenyl-phosphate/decaprenyl-phosphate GlcNAc-1-phosphate transferase